MSSKDRKKHGMRDRHGGEKRKKKSTKTILLGISFIWKCQLGKIYLYTSVPSLCTLDDKIA